MLYIQFLYALCLLARTSVHMARQQDRYACIVCMCFSVFKDFGAICSLFLWHMHVGAFVQTWRLGWLPWFSGPSSETPRQLRSSCWSAAILHTWHYASTTSIQSRSKSWIEGPLTVCIREAADGETQIRWRNSHLQAHSQRRSQATGSSGMSWLR